jgi:hypothetical protein
MGETRTIEELIDALGVDEYMREQFDTDRARLTARLCAKHGVNEAEIDTLIRDHRYEHSGEDPEDDYMHVMAMGRAAGWV